MSTKSQPPESLSEPLAIRPEDWSPRDVYHLLTSLVVPRPIGWISTISEHGVANLAPHSFFNMVAAHPAHLIFSSVGEKDTIRNCRATREFVASIATTALMESLNLSAADFPYEVSEIEAAGLTPLESVVVAPPGVREAPAQVECQVREIWPVGDSFVVLGEVVHIRVVPEVWHHGRVDAHALDPLCRLAGSDYARLGEIISIRRPTYADVLAGTVPKRPVPGESGQ